MLPPIRPRLLALDLDGTVVDERNSIPAPTLAALHSLSAAGMQLAFLTGRRPRTASPLLDVIGLPALVATNSGCLLWEYPAWRQLARRMFPAAQVAEIARLTTPYSVNFYLDAAASGIEFIQLAREDTPQISHHRQRYGGNTRTVDSVAGLDGHEITQVALPGPDEVVHRLLARVQASLDGQVLALAVRWPLLPTLALEVFHVQANKGAALQYFARRRGIARADCLAVGDDTNDVAMLSWAGHSVAMPQAQAEVAAAATVQLAGDGAHALAGYLAALLTLPEAELAAGAD